MKLPATLTLVQAAAVHRDMEQAVGQQTGSATFEVDASALGDFDTSALAVLLAAHRAAEARKLAFAIRGAPPKLNQLAALYGVGGLLGLQAPGM